MFEYRRWVHLVLFTTALGIAASPSPASSPCASSPIYNACDFNPWPFAAQGDLNRDLVVDVSDLLMLLGNWGPCPRSGACIGDLNGDGVVDVSDLLTLLGNWGPISFAGTEYGLALVWPKGPYDFVNAPQDVGIDPANLLDTLPLETVLLSHLGHYDPETGVYVSSNEGNLTGKYMETWLYTLDEYNFGVPYVNWPNISEQTRPDNDFMIDGACWGGFTGQYAQYNIEQDMPECQGMNQREAILWSSEVHAYYYITDYRRNVLTDSFIDDLNLPEELARNIKYRQFRPDLDMGEPHYIGKARIRQKENVVLQGLQVAPVANLVQTPLRTRGPHHPFATSPPASFNLAPEVLIGDYAGLAAFWVTETNEGFAGVALYGEGTFWQTNVLPPLNDGLSAFEAYRWSGNEEIYRNANWIARNWGDSSKCGGDSYPCDKGTSIRNVMMFNPGQTDKNGVFPYWAPSGFTGIDGPVHSNLAALFFAAVFYDMSVEAGLGDRNAALLFWKMVSLIDDKDFFPMVAFGEKTIEAARMLWPGDSPDVSRYEQDIADVLTSRGIPLYGNTGFIANLPDAVAPTVRNQYIGTGHPAAQPTINEYGAANWWTDEYLPPNVDETVQYMTYTFYKHSKFGPCDYVSFQKPDGTYTNGIPEPDGTELWRGEDRDIGNITVFIPRYIVQAGDPVASQYGLSEGDNVHILRTYNERARCPSEAEGYYLEDTRPFGFRVIQATKNGFSFHVEELAPNGDGDERHYLLTIVDPSVSFLGEASYHWEYENRIGDSQSLTTDSTGGFLMTATANEPFTIRITRDRNGTVDQLELNERANDFARSGGEAFYFVPEGFLE